MERPARKVSSLLEDAAQRLAFCGREALSKEDADALRGVEGEAAAVAEYAKAAEEAKKAAAFLNQEAAAPESGEARKADILAKLAAAFDTTQNKCIAITLNNYLHTAEGIAVEEFTDEVYDWYLNALKNFGFSFEAAAPESGSEEEEGEAAAAPEYQEAAADLVKTAAAVAFGFFGFYSVFAIFGV